MPIYPASYLGMLHLLKPLISNGQAKVHNHFSTSKLRAHLKVLNKYERRAQFIQDQERVPKTKQGGPNMTMGMKAIAVIAHSFDNCYNPDNTGHLN